MDESCLELSMFILGCFSERSVKVRLLFLGAGHQADGTSSRIVKLGTSSRKVPRKLVKYNYFENFF